MVYDPLSHMHATMVVIMLSSQPCEADRAWYQQLQPPAWQQPAESSLCYKFLLQVPEFSQQDWAGLSYISEEWLPLAAGLLESKTVYQAQLAHAYQLLYECFYYHILKVNDSFTCTYSLLKICVCIQHSQQMVAELYVTEHVICIMSVILTPSLFSIQLDL